GRLLAHVRSSRLRPAYGRRLRWTVCRYACREGELRATSESLRPYRAAGRIGVTVRAHDPELAQDLGRRPAPPATVAVAARLAVRGRASDWCGDATDRAAGRSNRCGVVGRWSARIPLAYIAVVDRPHLPRLRLAVDGRRACVVGSG